MEVLDPGMQVKELLRSLLSLESLLLPLLTPCRTVELFDNIVTPSRGNHLLMADVDQARDFPDGRPVTPKLIGVNDPWDVMFTQQLGQEGLRRFRITVARKENIEHEAVLVDRSPEPVSDTIDACTHLVQMPPGTPTGLSVAQFFCKEGAEFNAPLAEGLVADLNAALVKQFLHVSVTQGKAVVQPNCVLDDGHRETVAVRLGVRHGELAYPNPVKATQPDFSMDEISQMHS